MIIRSDAATAERPERQHHRRGARIPDTRSAECLIAGPRRVPETAARRMPALPEPHRETPGSGVRPRVRTPTAMKPSITDCRVAATRTTFPSTSCSAMHRAHRIDRSRGRGAVGLHALDHVRDRPPARAARGRFEAACSRTRASVAMNAVPISPPMSRAVCSAAPNVSASWGFKCRTPKKITPDSAKLCPTACSSCDGRNCSDPQPGVMV